jgi:uncharacterized protein (UPF0332 family)
VAAKRDEPQRWLKRAFNALKAAETLAAQELFDDSISRAYYAMFYAANALLVKDGINVGGRHSAVVAAFGQQYAKSGKIDSRYHRMLIQDFEWRQKADYDAFWFADRETAAGRLDDARGFVEIVAKLME